LRDLLDESSKHYPAATIVKIAKILIDYGDIYGCRLPSNILALIDRDELHTLMISKNSRTTVTTKEVLSPSIHEYLAVKRDDISHFLQAVLKNKDNPALQIL
jgi:hypothetical protein